MPDHIDLMQQLTDQLQTMTMACELIGKWVDHYRDQRNELVKALHECAYCLNSLEVPPSAMTKTTADTLVRLNLGGFND